MPTVTPTHDILTPPSKEIHSLHCIVDNGRERDVQWQWQGEIYTVAMVGRDMYSDNGGERYVQ